MQLSADEYLKEVYRDWEGDYEGDFDYVDGDLQRHDWGDFPHGRMHAQVMSWFGTHEKEWGILVMPSYTIQITPTRFRVPDLMIFDSGTPREDIAVTITPRVVIEVLSPEDTTMHLEALEEDYRQRGISNIWFIDPRRNIGWDCRRDAWHRVTTFVVPGTPISLDLSDLVDD
jgi:Uma2 family endonuclease